MFNMSLDKRKSSKKKIQINKQTRDDQRYIRRQSAQYMQLVGEKKNKAWTVKMSICYSVMQYSYINVNGLTLSTDPAFKSDKSAYFPSIVTYCYQKITSMRQNEVESLISEQYLRYSILGLRIAHSEKQFYCSFSSSFSFSILGDLNAETPMLILTLPALFIFLKPCLFHCHGIF